MPGSALGEGIGTADWQAVFSAMACYRTTSPTQQRDLAAAAAASAVAQTRLTTIVAAGGRILEGSEDGWRVADPEGNEMVIVSGA